MRSAKEIGAAAPGGRGSAGEDRGAAEATAAEAVVIEALEAFGDALIEAVDRRFREAGVRDPAAHADAIEKNLKAAGLL